MQRAHRQTRTIAQSSRKRPGGRRAAFRAADGVAALAGQCFPGWSLPRGFCSNDDVYRADLERIWRRGWLFAGHTCEIPHEGDFFTLEVDADSLIVIRGEDGAVRGLHNVCRHRGSLICNEPAGRSRKLVCPYHQWTYGLDGKLLACRGMPDDLDKSQFGLKRVHVRELDGLIYLSLNDVPPDFEPFNRLVSPLVRPQGFAASKVAKVVDYLVKANWKLVWENNRECYHCNTSRRTSTITTPTTPRPAFRRSSPPPCGAAKKNALPPA
jgi:Rieske 2Fe-2S family protein